MPVAFFFILYLRSFFVQAVFFDPLVKSVPGHAQLTGNGGQVVVISLEGVGDHALFGGLRQFLEYTVYGTQAMSCKRFDFSLSQGVL